MVHLLVESKNCFVYTVGKFIIKGVKMSEYQYYEWQALEHPLSTAEQNAVDALSSHIDVTASQAIVTYNWGDFKHDPLDVLAK